MRTLFAVSALCILALAISLTLVSPAVSAATPAAAPTPAPARVPQGHPDICAALGSLRSARAHIQQARHDFGGHRAEALKQVDRAINQVQVCMRYARSLSEVHALPDNPRHSTGGTALSSPFSPQL